jgi:hypothetical protein
MATICITCLTKNSALHCVCVGILWSLWRSTVDSPVHFNRLVFLMEKQWAYSKKELYLYVLFKWISSLKGISLHRHAIVYETCRWTISESIYFYWQSLKKRVWWNTFNIWYQQNLSNREIPQLQMEWSWHVTEELIRRYMQVICWLKLRVNYKYLCSN